MKTLSKEEMRMIVGGIQHFDCYCADGSSFGTSVNNSSELPQLTEQFCSEVEGEVISASALRGLSNFT